MHKSPKPVKDMNLETQGSPRRINAERATQWHLIVRTLRLKVKKGTEQQPAQQNSQVVADFLRKIEATRQSKCLGRMTYLVHYI